MDLTGSFLPSSDDCSASALAELDQVLAATARRILKVRALRNSVFGPDIFADPVWDMMLDLFVEASAKRDVTLTSVALASGVPTSTALRQLKDMERRGVVERLPARDGRMFHVRLTRDALCKLRLVLQKSNEGSGRVAGPQPGRVLPGIDGSDQG